MSILIDLLKARLRPSPVLPVLRKALIPSQSKGVMLL